MESAVKELSGADAIVVDIRDTGGGRDPESQLAAGFLISNPGLYMTSRKKSGPGRNEFSDAVEWYVNPEKDHLDKKIVLLTTRYTMSGAETFTLAMKTSDKVIQVGDTTGGAFSDNITREMYNGWIYTIAVGDYRDKNGVSYEGKGIAISQGTDSSKIQVCLHNRCQYG